MQVQGCQQRMQYYDHRHVDKVNRIACIHEILQYRAWLRQLVEHRHHGQCDGKRKVLLHRLSEDVVDVVEVQNRSEHSHPGCCTKNQECPAE